MVPYNLEDPSHAAVIEEAHQAGVGVLVKKGLGAGRLGAAEALRFALAPAGVSSVVVGSLSLDHLREDVEGVSGKQ
jgi:aryl-alcohol dehydrogenase-like predicted oxidoreductase